jgi:hypothetical protein
MTLKKWTNRPRGRVPSDESAPPQISQNELGGSRDRGLWIQEHKQPVGPIGSGITEDLVLYLGEVAVSQF